MNEQTTVTVKSRLSVITDRLRTFFRNLGQKIGVSMREKNYCYLSFALPIIVLYITYACVGMYPFGEKTILTLDMDGQYIYFFEQIRDIYTGKESLFYTFERSLGGEFLGCFTYYLASPLSLVVVLFPRNMITEAVMTITLLKCAFSGLNFSIYLSKTRKRNTVGFVMFSVMYALCSYATMYQVNTMWMDALMWLPIIALGIEKMITEGKFKLFIISLAIAISSNYYIGYMLCFFVFLYFIFCVAIKSDKESTLLNEKYHVLKSFIRITVSSVIALMLASAAILSAYYSLKFGKTDYQDNVIDSSLRFDFLHLMSKMFLGSFDTLRPEGTPNIYAGLLLILMLPVFYMSNKVKPKEKVGYTVLCLIFVACFSINAIDIAWHGFQTPVWFNYRYSFMFSFIMLSMAYRGYEEYDEVNVAFMGKVSVFLIFFLTIVQKVIVLFRYENPDGNGWVKVDTVPGYGMVWLSILFILVYLLIFYIRKKTNYLKTTTVVLAVVVMVEMFANSTVNWVGSYKDGGWASRDAYIEYVDNFESVTDEIYAKDPTFFRMERTTWRKQNDNLAINLNGLSESASTFNVKTIKFLDALGFFNTSPTTLYISGNAAVDSLLGIKYVIGSESEDTNGALPGLNSISNLYSLYTTKNGYAVYENPYVLPIAYRTETYIKDFEFDRNEYSPFKNVNKLAGYMLGKENVRLYETCQYFTNEGTLRSTSVDDEGGKSFYKYDNNSSGVFYFTVTAHTDGNVYMCLPSPYTTSATLTVNNKEIMTDFFQGESNRIIDLGYYERGEIVNVELSFSHYRLYIWDTQDYFVQINENTLKSVTDTLKMGGLQISEYSDTKIEGTVNSVSDGCIFTTIPYDSNWNVYVDGERVETYMLADALLGFDISAGEHTVELKYVHKPFVTGLIIGAFGIGLFILLCFLDKKYRRTLAQSVETCESTESDKAVIEITDENTKETEISEENNDIPS